MLKDELEEEGFDQMITDAIKALSDDDVRHGAELLIDIAKYWAKAGLDINSFLNMRQYIINEAVAKTDPLFIEEKLKLEETKLREMRNGTRIIISH